VTAIPLAAVRSTKSVYTQVVSERNDAENFGELGQGFLKGLAGLNQFSFGNISYCYGERGIEQFVIGKYSSNLCNVSVTHR
jgi:hypothetical protein